MDTIDSKYEVMPSQRKCQTPGCEVMLEDEPAGSVELEGQRFVFRPVYCEMCITNRWDRVRNMNGSVDGGQDRKWEWACKDALFRAPFDRERLPAYAKQAPGSVPVVDAVLQWDVTSERGIGLLGKTGSGKSMLLHALLRRCYVDDGKSVYLLPMTEFARVCASLQNEERLKMIAKAISVDLLLLDDLGKEKPTARVETDLQDVLDARYRKAKPLFVTTERNKRELLGKFSVENGPAILRRVMAGCEFRTLVLAESKTRKENR